MGAIGDGGAPKTEEAKMLQACKEEFEKAYKEMGGNVAETGDSLVLRESKYSERSLDAMTPAEYNNHGWVKANGVLSDEKMANFLSRVGDKERARADWYGNLGNGLHMIATKEGNGADNTVVITNGDFKNPSIERVYEINLEKDTDVEIVRDAIYELERYNKGRTTGEVVNDIFKDEPVRCISKEDCKTYREFRQERERAKSQGAKRNSSELRDNTGSRTDSKQSIGEPPQSGSFNATEAKEIIDNTDAEDLKEHGPEVKYSRVTKPETLKFLDDQEKAGKVVETYRAMVMIDGKLYPPMATKLKSAERGGKAKLQNPNELGVWEQAEEHPELLDKNGKFVLKKDKGTDVPAAYNPYIHSSFSPLNDQFTSAYKRPNLVVVKGIVPESELTSGYHAEGAKDAVGKTQWHSGVVAGKLPEAREVMLSRWFKPIEVMDDAEVASIIKDTLSGTDIEIPYNVVTPGLRRALEDVGVPIGEGQGIRNLPPKDSVKYSKGYHAGDLGKSESLFQQSGGRSTGHYGTGTYFVGNKARIEGYNTRHGKPAPVEEVEFDNYNLYKPKDTKDAQELHDNLKFIDDYYTMMDSPYMDKGAVSNVRERVADIDSRLQDVDVEYNPRSGWYEPTEVGQFEMNRLGEETRALMEEHGMEDDFLKIVGHDDFDGNYTDRQLMEMFDTINDNSYYSWASRAERTTSNLQKLDDVAKYFGMSRDDLINNLREIHNETKDIPWDKQATEDSAATRFMKKLGYEGVDVRHTDLDNTTYGSVIYDLKGKDLARKQEIGTARFSKSADIRPETVTNGKGKVTREALFLREM